MNLLQRFVNFLVSQKNKPSFLTVKNYKADIGQFINWFERKFNSSFDPSKITPQILEQYKKTRTLSSSSIQRHISSLRKFFSFLRTTGVINFELFPAQDNKGKIEPDPWMLKNFKNHLYEYKKSNLTIKNYINDIKSFFVWLAETSLTKYAWDVTERNLLDKINFFLVDEYKQRLIAVKFSPRTINRKLSSLRNYIAWAKSQGLIPSGPSGHPERSEGSRDSSPLAQNDNGVAYSSFPPVRLMQKSLKGINNLFDNLFILPIAQTIETMQYLLWKAGGKKIFTKNVILTPLKRGKNPMGSFGFQPQDDISRISNIAKEFYAPLSISTRYLSVHKRVWHYLRHVRPNWYKKYHSYSVTHYFHFAILIILASAIGFAIYNGLSADAQKESSILAATSFAPSRILSFQGKLTDSSDNPIATTASVLFSIYNDQNASGSAFLWQETNSIKPDSDGIFSVFLGKNTPIPDTLFSQNPQLFLGITVGSGPQLSPRQQLATAHFASNSETLQGLEPITNTTKVSNVVLALDSQGNLSIAGSKAHTFQAIGGQFVLSGSILSLTTVPGSNSRVEIVPDGMGKIDFSKPIQNSTNNNNLISAAGSVEFDDTVAILATTSAQAALYINQNSTGALISASTSGTAKFVVENDGSGIFSADLGINGGDLTSTATTFNLLNTTVTTLNFAGATTNLVLGASSGTITIRNENAKIEGNVTLGDAATDTIIFTGRVAQDSDLIPIGTTGTNDLGSSSLPWDNAYIDNIYASSIGIGTTTPTFKLDIQGSQDATGAAQIFNTSTNTDADGLIVKLGNTASTVANANHFISFETSGLGIVGSIRGNETGVQYQTNGIADFAEYFEKDKDQAIEFGSVVCLSDNGLVVPCDENNGKILGIASERPAFLGGENLGDRSITVGLVGQVDTFVSLASGAIKAGDALSASDIPGVAVKATKAGQIVAKALENLDTINESEVVGYYDPDSKEYRSKANFPDIPLKPKIIKVVKINTFVNTSWYDPGAYLANNGDLIIHKTGSNGYSIADESNQTLTNIESFFKVTAANIKAGYVHAQALTVAGLINASEVITSSLVVTTDTIIVNGQNLKDYIASVVEEQAEIISPVVRTAQLSTNIISPLSSDSAITIDGKLVILSETKGPDSSPSAQNDIALEIQGNASFSGQLQTNELLTNQLTTNDASISGILRARSIIAESIEGFIDIASFSAQLAYVPNLQTEQGLFNQGLMVFGSTSLSDLSIAGNLSIGGTMFITENSIETLGTSLSLQSLRQGGLSIMGGLVYVDTDGNLKIQGDVSIGGKLAVNIISPLPTSDLVINNASGSGVLSISKYGDVIASGSGTFSKLNFSFVEPALAVSPTELIASSSAGVANITPYYDEVTIRNPLVTEKSVIYITPVGTPSAQTPFLTRQTSKGHTLEGSFTVGVDAPNKNPIPFNWLIVN